MSLAPAESQNKATHSALPSQHFRNEHIEIKKELSEIEQLTGQLRVINPLEQKELMSRIVTFFRKHITPHAQWEEKKLYPAIDQRANKEGDPFTSSMRFEHKIVERWIEDLAQQASEKSPNALLFARKADQLLGLIFAHFETEEAVLLPILDKSMTAAKFKEEILSDKSH